VLVLEGRQHIVERKSFRRSGCGDAGAMGHFLQHGVVLFAHVLLVLLALEQILHLLLVHAPW
jgi:hypothetical protein